MIAISISLRNGSYREPPAEAVILPGPADCRPRYPLLTFPILLACAFLLIGCSNRTGTEDALSVTPDQTTSTQSQRERGKELVALAEKALKQKRLKDAELLLERALAADPGNPEVVLNYGELHLARAELQKAASTFTALMSEDPVRARALQGRGIAALLLGDTTIGRESLEQAVTADPTLWRAWNALGFLEDSNQNWIASDANYGKALTQNPGSAMIYNNRGFSRMMQRRVPEAIDDLSRALQIDQEFALARENLRLAYAWDGKYHLALSGVENQALPRVLNNVGYIAILRKDFAQAEAYLHRAMELSPRYHQQAAKNLAFLEEQRGIDRGSNAAQLP